jgi:uncharacterized membrane protein
MTPHANASLAGQTPEKALNFWKVPRIRPTREARALAAAVILALPLACMAQPAAADFRLCNKTSARLGVAVGYKDGEGWTTEGWWNLPAGNCETVLKGALVARFYYIYAVDYDHGGEWSGQAFMCTRDKEFTIHGTEDCLARGYERTGFFEVDTGEQRSWEVRLTDAGEQAQQPSPPGAPTMTIPQSPGRGPAAPPAPAAPGMPAGPSGTQSR